MSENSATPYTFGIEVSSPFGADSFYLGSDEVLHEWLVKPFAEDAFTLNTSMLLPLPEGYFVWNEVLFDSTKTMPAGLGSLKDANDCVRVSVGSPFDDKAQYVIFAMHEVSSEKFWATDLDEDVVYTISEY